MEISINYTRPDGDPGGGPVKIGLLMTGKTASVIYLQPERPRSAGVNRTHAKSASRCPAILALENRYMVVRYPFDLHLGFSRDKMERQFLKIYLAINLQCADRNSTRCWQSYRKVNGAIQIVRLFNLAFPTFLLLMYLYLCPRFLPFCINKTKNRCQAQSLEVAFPLMFGHGL